MFLFFWFVYIGWLTLFGFLRLWCIVGYVGYGFGCLWFGLNSLFDSGGMMLMFVVYCVSFVEFFVFGGVMLCLLFYLLLVVVFCFVFNWFCFADWWRIKLARGLFGFAVSSLWICGWLWFLVWLVLVDRTFVVVGLNVLLLWWFVLSFGWLFVCLFGNIDYEFVKCFRIEHDILFVFECGFVGNVGGCLRWWFWGWYKT